MLSGYAERRKLPAQDPASYDDEGNMQDGSNPGYAQLLDLLVMKAAGKESEYQVATTRPVADVVGVIVKSLATGVSIT